MKFFSKIGGEAVKKSNQTFFILESIRRLRLSSLPLSAELAAVFKKLRIDTFRDLAGRCDSIEPLRQLG
jgi:hypothetical protein